MALHRRRDERDRVIIGLGRVRVVLVVAVDVAQRDDGVIVLRIARDDRLQAVECFLLAVEALQADGDLHVGIGAERQLLRHLRIGLDGLLVLLHVLVGVAQQGEHHRPVGVEGQRQPRIEKRHVDALLVRHRGCQREQCLGGPCAGRCEEGLRLAFFFAASSAAAISGLSSLSRKDW